MLDAWERTPLPEAIPEPKRPAAVTVPYLETMVTYLARRAQRAEIVGTDALNRLDASETTRRTNAAVQAKCAVWARELGAPE